MSEQAQQNGAVVAARDVTRRYGEGDTAVDALRGVTVEIAPGKATAVMGPSGSGKSTLMHILAGLDKPTSGSVGIAGTEITTLGDNDLTKLRREHIGFVFQFFNLLPMLSAKENILLPLTIAGEKPDERVVRPARLGRRARRPALAPPVRALGRPAAACRDRARARLEADGALRGRADREPRLADRSAEILELLRRSVDEYGQTIVMVTHDARAASRAHRVLFLADGEIVREVGECDQRRIHGGHGRGRRGVIKVALRGLAGRKLRAVLTGIAIVLGVAMISGTYILTDTIDRAFTNLFAESYAGTDAVVTGKRPRHLDRRRERRRARPSTRRLLETVRGVDGVALATGQRPRRGQHEDPHARGRGRELGGRADIRVRDRHEPAARAVQPAARPRGTVARLRRRGRHRRGHGGRAGLRGRGHRRDHDPPAEAAVRARRRRAVRRASTASGTRRFVVFTIPAAQELLDREGQYDAISVAAEEGTSEDELVAAIEPVLPRKREVVSATRGGGGGAGRGERVHVDLPLLPPRLRGDRALRRRVRHLQHLLDHRRPADARVRDAADDRRVPAPGSRLGDPRVARHRPPRVARRPRSRRAARGGDRGALRQLSGSSCRPQTASSRCARSSSRSSWASASRSRRGCSRRSARRACRRSRRFARVRRYRRHASRRFMPWIAGLVVVGLDRAPRARDVHGRAGHQRSAALHRRGRAPALPRRRDARVTARQADRGRRRAARTERRRRGRPPRERKLRAQPGPNRGDGGGADDRHRPRLVHRDAHERDEGVEPASDRGAGRGRLRRDLARRVHAVRRPRQATRSPTRRCPRW